MYAGYTVYMDIYTRLELGAVRRDSGCLEWTRATTKGGYGLISYRGKLVYVHRLVWELQVGPIPEGQWIRHYVCDNPCCCEVTHLRTGTSAQNVADRVAHGRTRTGMGRHESAKTHCPSNHAYDEANTSVNAKGHRRCKKCGRARSVANRLKKRQEG